MDNIQNCDSYSVIFIIRIKSFILNSAFNMLSPS
jgi:hypothetical protein